MAGPLETLWLLSRLVTDLLAVPWHLLVFLLTRSRQRRRFAEALARSTEFRPAGDGAR